MPLGDNFDPRWDIFFLQQARLTSLLSKDPSTKVGAVITRDNEIIASGYNGFPRKIPDLGAWYKDRERKLLFTEHAEINAILSAGRSGHPVNGCTLYSTHFSCNECCKHTIQSGIDRFVYIEDPVFQARWNSDLVFEMFEYAGIELVGVTKEQFTEFSEQEGLTLKGYE